MTEVPNCKRVWTPTGSPSYLIYAVYNKEIVSTYWSLANVALSRVNNNSFLVKQMGSHVVEAYHKLNSIP